MRLIKYCDFSLKFTITFTEKNQMWLNYPEIIVRHEFEHAIDFDGRGCTKILREEFYSDC